MLFRLTKQLNILKTCPNATSGCTNAKNLRKFAISNMTHGSSFQDNFENFEQAYDAYLPIIINNIRDLNQEMKLNANPAKLNRL